MVDKKTEYDPGTSEWYAEFKEHNKEGLAWQANRAAVHDLMELKAIQYVDQYPGGFVVGVLDGDTPRAFLGPQSVAYYNTGVSPKLRQLYGDNVWTLWMGTQVVRDIRARRDKNE
ncbi:hypothetical protein CMI42_03855 [Candidatus Pacearchaeota archaeon]|nr:hypothetical protein [Candidatus Pacearchaeota archaeon]|tara:strand:+ start:752 stop:1096 length:345 start_codon:yes stop_codon:yes gene_type:complete